MKHLCIFLCFILPILANVIPEAEKNFLKKVHGICQADNSTYVDEDVLKKLKEHAEDSRVQVHMMCMAIEAGLQRADGELNVDVIRGKIALASQAKFAADEVVNKCAVKNGTPERTGTLLWLCLIDNGIPYHVL